MLDKVWNEGFMSVYDIGSWVKGWGYGNARARVCAPNMGR